jgi:hypothetical protein
MGEASSMSEWYYSQDNRQLGPVTWERLQQMAASGELRPDDLVWQHPMPNWQPAGRVDGLQAPAPSAPPPYQSPAANPFDPRSDSPPAFDATDVAQPPIEENPYAAPRATTSAYPHDPWAERRRAAGWITQVTVVSILMMIQGTLECLLSLMFPLVGLTQPDNGADAPLVVFIGLGIVIFLSGALKLAAGIMNYRFRGRVLGFVALGSGLVSLCTCYCFPTALALGVYGLIVLLNEHVGAAFSLGAQGLSRAEILSRYY